MPRLRSTDSLLEPQVRATVAALQLSDADAGLVALAVTLAQTIDAMSDDTKALMIAQTAGQLRNVLKDLQSRAAAPAQPAGPNRLQLMRDARRA